MLYLSNLPDHNGLMFAIIAHIILFLIPSKGQNLICQDGPFSWSSSSSSCSACCASSSSAASCSAASGIEIPSECTTQRREVCCFFLSIVWYVECAILIVYICEVRTGRYIILCLVACAGAMRIVHVPVVRLFYVSFLSMSLCLCSSNKIIWSVVQATQIVRIIMHLL